MRAWTAAIAGLAIAGTVSYVIAGRRRVVTYAEARSVVDRRCVECHSERPTNRAFPIAPKGIVLDTAGEMQLHARRIEVRAVVERTMPLANLSGMTDDERWILGRWIEQGAELTAQ